MYKTLRSLLFLLPPEKVHYLAMNVLQAICAVPFLQKSLARFFAASCQPVQLFNLRFKNKVGLGAGFDKNAKYLTELGTLGFGFVEIGTVTPEPQAGNDKPRLFRLAEDKALINRMGFNNDGATVIAERLRKWRERNGGWKLKDASNNLLNQSSLLIGGNIGKNKATPNEAAVNDYEICFKALHPYVDFFVVNVSSPNTPGLRALQDKESLRTILTRMQFLNKTFSVQRPLLLKIAPDLTEEQLMDVAQLANEIALDGLVATNTTIDRKDLKTNKTRIKDIGTGGLSGAPLRNKSTGVIQFLRNHTTLPIIGSGGIFTAADAAEKLGAGAQLIEVWTGFVYEGPAIAKNICSKMNQPTANKNS